MRRHLRVLIVIAGAALFVGISELFPAVLRPDSIRVGSGVFVAVSALLLLFYRRFNAVTGVGSLNFREMERFTMRRAVIRSRMWIVAGSSTLCALALWVMSEFAASLSGAIWFPLAVGSLLSVGVVYCLTVARWIIELDEFSDRLRLAQERKASEEAMLKRLSDGKKQTV